MTFWSIVWQRYNEKPAEVIRSISADTPQKAREDDCGAIHVDGHSQGQHKGGDFLVYAEALDGGLRFSGRVAPEEEVENVFNLKTHCSGVIILLAKSGIKWSEDL